MWAEATIHLVVLGVMMPGRDGLILWRWRVAPDGPPVLLLTTMVDGTDRIAGLELETDDYLIKPFNPRELLARVRATLRPAPPETVSPPSGPETD